jgi:hypothetical protein
VAVHKLQYFLNAKIVGAHRRRGLGTLLAILVIVPSVAGVVLA